MKEDDHGDNNPDCSKKETRFQEKTPFEKASSRIDLPHTIIIFYIFLRKIVILYAKKEFICVSICASED